MLDWLLDADPSIRWQVMRDLTEEPTGGRRRRAGEGRDRGLGRAVARAPGADGLWSGSAFSQDHTDTFHCLELLRRLGLDPASAHARRGGRTRSRPRHLETAPGGTRRGPTIGFFEGEVEPCINGNVVATGAWFGVDMTPLVERLLGEQLADGGWNCEVENGATVSSFGTTINVLEALLAYERGERRRGDRAAEARDARLRGEAYLLERRLFRRKSTGEVIDPSWLRFSFPTWWHYDILRGLDHLRDAGTTGGPPRRRGGRDRAEQEARRRPLALEQVHAGESFFHIEAGREAKPLDHAHRPARDRLVRPQRLTRFAHITTCALSRRQRVASTLVSGQHEDHDPMTQQLQPPRGSPSSTRSPSPSLLPACRWASTAS